MGSGPKYAIAAAHGDGPLQHQEVGISGSVEAIVAVEGFESARARVVTLRPPYRSHRRSIFERRFSACRLTANAFASWQPMHAIHMVDQALQR